MAKPLVLVDGSSYLYRAFHALPPLTTADGRPTGAVLGVTNMLVRLLKEQDPEYIAVVFDAPGKTFRDDMYAEYKANRPPMPDELREQIEPVNDIVRALGLPLLRIPGVEADDVIGTLAENARANGMKTLISTSDKDLAQLVDKDVTLVNSMTDTVMDIEGVQKKFGVSPEQIVDYLGLVGDTSDNIPGVPKVGPKTAAKWLIQYETLDGIIEHADEIKGKVGESLREHIDDARLSRRLATIKRDAETGVSYDELARNAPETEALRTLYREFELRSLLKSLGDGDGDSSTADISSPATSEPAADRNYETVVTKKAFDAWLRKLKKADAFAFDTETTSLDYITARIVGVSFAIEPGAAAYVPFAHVYPGAPDQLSEETVLGSLKPLLEDEKKKKIGHHLKYDAHVLANHGIELAGIEFDTMLESYVLDSTATRHDMDSVAGKYLGIETIKYEEVAGKGAKQITFDQVGLEQAGPYAAEDADITLKLHEALWSRLEKIPALVSVYSDIEKPLIPVLTQMEAHGVLVDTKLLGTQSGEIAKKLLELQKECFAIANTEFNLDSPKQLQEVLFEKLNIPVIRKTRTGQPSTAEDVLQELADAYELPGKILEYRSLAKLKSTYTDKLPKQVDPKTGRIHTSYHQAVAATGRLSSSAPNLQNIPIRSAEGRRIRQAFVAPRGYRILAADYSQIELRIMAHLSEDESLLTAFSEDQDIHSATAAEVFGVKPAKVSKDQRRSAKAINFGLIYGMSAFGLARQLGIDRHSAQKYVDLYFERYPGVKEFMDRTRKKAHEDGFVETVFGRRLYLPEINARSHQRRQYAERSAINAPMQGTAADIIKRSMISLAGWLVESDADARLVMQVHDELVFEVKSGQADELGTEIVRRMAGAAELAVPLKVDLGVGQNWDEAH